MNHANNLDFNLGNGDDSWYQVSIALQNGKLTVHFECFSDKRDEGFKVEDGGVFSKKHS